MKHRLVTLLSKWSDQEFPTCQSFLLKLTAAACLMLNLIISVCGGKKCNYKQQQGCFQQPVFPSLTAGLMAMHPNMLHFYNLNPLSLTC